MPQEDEASLKLTAQISTLKSQLETSNDAMQALKQQLKQVRADRATKLNQLFQAVQH